jgi:hypothetical protein
LFPASSQICRFPRAAAWSVRAGEKWRHLGRFWSAPAAPVLLSAPLARGNNSTPDSISSAPRPTDLLSSRLGPKHTSEEVIFLPRCCPYCQQAFQPSKHRPDQSVCTRPACQARRLSPSSQTPSPADVPQFLLTLTAREDVYALTLGREKPRPVAARLSGGWRRRVPAGPRRRFWQHQNRPKWCRFIPALTVITAHVPSRESYRSVQNQEGRRKLLARRPKSVTVPGMTSGTPVVTLSLPASPWGVPSTEAYFWTGSDTILLP